MMLETDDQQQATPNWIRLSKNGPGLTARRFCLIQMQLDLFGGARFVRWSSIHVMRGSLCRARASARRGS